MTDTEKKLAFLLATSPYLDTVSGSYDEAARDLVANGVVTVYEDIGLTAEELRKVFPVPLGKPVYVVERCTCLRHDKPLCHRSENVKVAARWKAETVIPMENTKRGKRHCEKVFLRPFDLKHVGQVGKTVFLTMDEVHAALKRRGDDDT